MMLFLRLVDLGLQEALLPPGHLCSSSKTNENFESAQWLHSSPHWGEHCLELSLQTRKSSNAITGSQRMLCLKWMQVNLCTSYLSWQKWYRSESRWGRNYITIYVGYEPRSFQKFEAYFLELHFQGHQRKPIFFFFSSWNSSCKFP